MKIIKKITTICLLLGVLFLTGCGIEVKTDMTINNQFEGSKVISCFVSRQDMNLHFKGDSSKIDAMLDNHCPSCFEHSKKETSSGTEYLFTLHFSSLDDYITALRSVLNFGPEVKYKGVNSIFSKSIDLSENFTSIDLLRWFEILLTEEYEISAGQLDSLWDIKDTTLLWMDQVYISPSDSMQISDHHYSAFDGISIYTEEHDDRTFTRRIQFSIPKTTLDTRVLELEQLFEEMKPEGTTGIWTTTATGKIYEMTFQADTFSKLSEKTGHALNSKTQNVDTNSSITNHQYLEINLEYSETLDFSRFLSTESGEVPVTYYFKPNSYTEIDSERLQKEINNAFIPKIHDDGYYRIYQGNCSSLKITTIGLMYPPVTACDITTTLKNNHLIQREFLFTINDILHPDEETLLSTLAKSNSNDLLKIEFTKGKSTHTLSFFQSGILDEINQSSASLFGSDINLMAMKEPDFLDFISNKKMIEMKENINLTDYIGTYNDSIIVNYMFKNHSSNKLEDLYLVTDSGKKIQPVSVNENTHLFENAGTQFSSNYIGSTPSILGISIFVLLFLLIIIGIIIFIKINPLKNNSVTNTISED